MNISTVRFMLVLSVIENFEILYQLRLRNEFLLSIMGMIFFYTLLATTWLFPLAMRRNAELIDWQVVLAFVHLFTDYNNLLFYFILLT